MYSDYCYVNPLKRVPINTSNAYIFSAMSSYAGSVVSEPNLDTEEEGDAGMDSGQPMMTEEDARVLDSDAESEAPGARKEPTPDEREERRKKRAALVARAKELIKMAEAEDENERLSSLRSASPKGNKSSSSVDIITVAPANPSGAGSKLSNDANPSGARHDPSNPRGDGQGPSNPRGDGHLEGQDAIVNENYRSVYALRAGTRTNPSFNRGGGLLNEKNRAGSFSSKDDNRTELAHFRSILESKLNISFSFDPKSMLCSNCLGRGSHPVCGGGGDPTGIYSDRSELSGCIALQPGRMPEGSQG